MPKVGKEEFDYTPEGIAEAEAYSEATGVPISNAMDRVQNYQLGGLVGGSEIGGNFGGFKMPERRIPPTMGRGTGRLGQHGAMGLPQMGVPGYKKGGKVTVKKKRS